MTSIYKNEKVNSISQTRFVILCVATFGIYQTWWIYKSWRFFNDKDNLETNPATRTIFSVFYLIPLFQRIQIYSKENNLRASYSSIFLYVGIVGLSVLSLNDSLWLISMFSFIFFIRPFTLLNNTISNDPNYQLIKKSKYNGRQWVLLGIGILFWTLLLIGFFLTFEEASNDYIINMSQDDINNLLNEANK